MIKYQDTKIARECPNCEGELVRRVRTDFKFTKKQTGYYSEFNYCDNCKYIKLDPLFYRKV